ncbi:hypothetical protein Dimus_019059 [Dionaea muscipula]
MELPALVVITCMMMDRWKPGRARRWLHRPAGRATLVATWRGGCPLVSLVARRRSSGRTKGRLSADVTGRVEEIQWPHGLTSCRRVPLAVRAHCLPTSRASLLPTEGSAGRPRLVLLAADDGCSWRGGSARSRCSLLGREVARDRCSLLGGRMELARVAAACCSRGGFHCSRLGSAGHNNLLLAWECHRSLLQCSRASPQPVLLLAKCQRTLLAPASGWSCYSTLCHTAGSCPLSNLPREAAMHGHAWPCKAYVDGCAHVSVVGSTIAHVVR